MPEIIFLEPPYSELTLKEYLSYHTPKSWEPFFSLPDVQIEIYKISEFLKSNKHRVVFPEMKNIFKAFYLTPLPIVRVLVLSQDPYFNGSAVGLCFSVKKGNVINPSLRNIYKELKREGFNPNENGDLSSWTRQGVLMLNASLTVFEGEADSHTYVWTKFTKLLLKFLSERIRDSKIVCLLLGKNAISFSEFLPSKSFTLLFSSHPSPLGCNKESNTIYEGKNFFVPAFVSSDIFKKCNKELGDSAIEW